jgi:hypothetical protein
MKPLLSVLFFMVLAACSPASEVVTSTKASNIVPTSTEIAVYRDTTNKFELTYSRSDFGIDSYRYPGENLGLLLDVENNFSGTNLEEVRVSLAVNPTCQYIEGYGSTVYVENAAINGVNFTKYSARDSGSKSNIFETITYQTFHDENCYEIHINIREYSLDRLPDLTEYSRPLLGLKVDSLINSFRFIE